MADKTKIPVSIHLVNTDLFEATSFNDLVNEMIEDLEKTDEHFRESKRFRQS